MTLLLSALSLSTGGLLGLLLKVAICCVVIWAIYALLAWAGITIPRPVQIILIALVCILIIYWLFEIFGSLVSAERPCNVFGRTMCPTCECHDTAKKVVWINKRTSDSMEGVIVR